MKTSLKLVEISAAKPCYRRTSLSTHARALLDTMAACRCQRVPGACMQDRSVLTALFLLPHWPIFSRVRSSWELRKRKLSERGTGPAAKAGHTQRSMQQNSTRSSQQGQKAYCKAGSSHRVAHNRVSTFHTTESMSTSNSRTASHCWARGCKVGQVMSGYAVRYAPHSLEEGLPPA